MFIMIIGLGMGILGRGGIDSENASAGIEKRHIPSTPRSNIPTTPKPCRRTKLLLFFILILPFLLITTESAHSCDLFALWGKQPTA